MVSPVPPGGLPQNPPVVGTGGASGQPPFGGAGGASMPTPNHGAQANAIALVAVAIKILEKVIPSVGVGSELGKDVIKALNMLSKHVTPGEGSQGVEQNALQNLMSQGKQDNPMLQAMKAQGTPGGAPGGAPPGGAMPPLPSVGM